MTKSSDHHAAACEWLAEYGLRYWPDVTPRWSDNDMVTAFEAGKRCERQRSGRGAMTDRERLVEAVERLRAERDEIMRQFAIETDESLTECVVRNIDGWKQRALKAEERERALREVLEECARDLEA